MTRPTLILLFLATAVLVPQRIAEDVDLRDYFVVRRRDFLVIMTILAAVAMPAYQTYADRARFSEVVLQTTPYKSAAEVAVQTGRAANAGDLDAGNFGIPANNTGIVGQFVASVTMEDGTVEAVSQNIGTADTTFQLIGSVQNGGIVWTETGPCRQVGLC